MDDNMLMVKRIISVSCNIATTCLVRPAANHHRLRQRQLRIFKICWWCLPGNCEQEERLVEVLVIALHRLRVFVFVLLQAISECDVDFSLTAINFLDR